MIPWSMDGVVRREDMISNLKRKLKVLKNIFLEKIIGVNEPNFYNFQKNKFKLISKPKSTKRFPFIKFCYSSTFQIALDVNASPNNKNK
jgi:hypothetical protein